VEGLNNAQGFEPPLIAKLRHELSALRGNWFWSVFLGIALIVLGVVALGWVMIAFLAPALAIGTLLLPGRRGRSVGRVLVPELERFLLAPAPGRVVDCRRSLVPPSAGRRPGGLDATGGVFSDGRRNLQDRGSRGLPVCDGLGGSV